MTGTISMLTLEITQGCWNADTGSPMAFLQWRALIARAAGYPMEIQNIDGARFEAPALPLESVTEENALGVWDTPPDDIVLVLLIHMSHDGVITPRDAGPLADELQRLLDIGAIAEASYASPDSIVRHVERMRTEQFIHGLRVCVKSNDPAQFFIMEGDDE